VLSLGALASAALAARAGAITARKLTVQNTDSPGGAWVAGSQPLLRRMVDNVIDNAVGHNVDGGWISVATGADGAVAVLAVETGGGGPGPRQGEQHAPPLHPPAAGPPRREKRAARRRGGAKGGGGWGLAIAAAIADAHGGTVALRTRPEGGLRVAVRLPLATPAATPRAGARP